MDETITVDIREGYQVSYIKYEDRLVIREEKHGVWTDTVQHLGHPITDIFINVRDSLIIVGESESLTVSILRLKGRVVASYTNLDDYTIVPGVLSVLRNSVVYVYSLACSTVMELQTIDVTPGTKLFINEELDIIMVANEDTSFTIYGQIGKHWCKLKEFRKVVGYGGIVDILLDDSTMNVAFLNTEGTIVVLEFVGSTWRFLANVYVDIKTPRIDVDNPEFRKVYIDGTTTMLNRATNWRVS